MAASFIQVAPDSNGKKMQTWDNLISGNQVHSEAVVLVDEFGVPISGLPVSGTVELGAATLAALENVTVTVSSEVEIKNDAGNPIPISAASLPLPTGAAQDGTDITTPVPAMPAGGVGIRGWLSAIWTKLNATLAVTGTVEIGATSLAALEDINVTVSSEVEIKNDSGNPVPVSAASLPLPSGAATEASLAAQSLVDNAGFTDGTSRVVPSGHIFDEVAGTALTENDIGASRIDSKRAQVAVFEDAVTRGTRATIKAASTVPTPLDTALVVTSRDKVAITAIDGDIATLGSTSGAAVVTDAAGTLQQYLRGLVKLIAAKIGITIADGDNATQGITTGAAVVTDATGTLQQYLRGLVKMFGATYLGQKTKAGSLAVTIASDQDSLNVTTGGLSDTQLRASAVPVSLASVPSHAVTNAGTFAVQSTVVDGGNAVEGTTTGAAVTTNAAGTLQQYLRGIVTLLAGFITVKIDQTTPGTTNAVAVTRQQGAANLSCSQVTTSTTSGTLAIARATRRSILIRNLDAAITVYVGTGTVTSSNGFPLLAGESCPFSWVGAINVIAASGTPVVAIADEFD
jgi:hypothetical protein